MNCFAKASVVFSFALLFFVVIALLGDTLEVAGQHVPDNARGRIGVDIVYVWPCVLLGIVSGAVAQWFSLPGSKSGMIAIVLHCWVAIWSMALLFLIG
jgi:hypothetical protein